MAHGLAEIQSVTVGFPVADLERAIAWYRQVFGLQEPDLQPADGVVEFRLGPLWLQLGEEPSARSGAQVITRLGVADAGRARERLIALGVAVSELHQVPGAVDYVDFADPDGNRLSFYSEV